MNAGSKLAGMARFARGVRGLLDETLTLEDAQRAIRDGVKNRSARFLGNIENSVFANPRSPYRKLLREAGCEAGDIARLVAGEGLEGALAILARAGVYVDYEEFKGRKPTVRGSRRFHFIEADFNNPLIEEGFSTTSSGTRGAPSRIPIDVDSIVRSAPHWAVFLAENGCFESPLIFWTPGHAGAVNRQLACAKFGRKYARWFVSEEMRGAKERCYASLIHWLARRAAGFPRPEHVSFSEPEPVLKCLSDLLRRGAKPCVNTAPSAAVKLSLAAVAVGQNLTGVTFLLGAEPLTPARRSTIEACGARAVPLYGSSEATWIGGQCRNPLQPDETHVLLDAYAVIAAADPSPVDDARTLLLTSLLDTAPKVLLNTDIGDRAVIATRSCDCLYDRLGCRLVVHTIRSSDKITELGVNFAVSDVFHVLEEIFPRKFGGAAGDYQLVESRHTDGLPRYTLRVHPKIAGIDGERLPETFLSEMAKLRSYYRFMTQVWAKEDCIRVSRGPALAGPGGKTLPFYRAPESARQPGSGER